MHKMTSSKLEKKEANIVKDNLDIKEVDISQSFSLCKHVGIEFDNLLNE